MINVLRLRAISDQANRRVAIEQEAQKRAEERAAQEEAERAYREVTYRAAQIVERIPTICNLAAQEGKREAEIMELRSSEFQRPHDDSYSPSPCSDGTFDRSWLGGAARIVYDTLKAVKPPVSMRIDDWYDPPSGHTGSKFIVHW